ncbi:Uncharacterised protein [Plesiomonas shigelloides]|nr:Uncharacterised protein [Plesiomonas shigelloides]
MSLSCYESIGLHKLGVPIRKSDIGALLADIGLPLYGYDNLLMASKVKCLKTHHLYVKYNKQTFFMHFSTFRVSECQRWCMASVGETSAGSAVS